MSRRFHVCLVLCSSLVVFACGGDTRRPSAGAEGPAPSIIKIDGSSTVFPITEAAAEEFQKEHRDLKVTVGISGTGGGFQKFCRGETDVSDASRPIKPVEIETCTRSGLSFVELPIAYDGLAVLVHPRNAWVESMTVSELKRLWEPAAEGRIKRWSQVRTGWPDHEVHLFGPGVDSGTFDYFTEAIVGKEKASRGDFTSSEDDNVLVQGIEHDELALGYFGYAYYAENKARLKLVAIDDQKDENGKGPVAPSPETVRNGTYRPLSRPLFIYVNQNALARPEIKSFVAYYLTKGVDLVREVGYVPLRDREYLLVRQRFGAGTTGTMFGAAGASTTFSGLEALLSASGERR